MQRGAWVCLMYHDVTPGGGGTGGGPSRFTVSVTSFELMLDTVAAMGRAGTSLAAALDAGTEPRVAITFDDGTIGQFEHAAPALRARNMTATFFVTTDWVGTPGFMSWDHLRQLTDWGMSVQSHSKSHPHLSELDDRALRAELWDSKEILDQALGQDTKQIALPGGNAPKHASRRLLAEAGYEIVATSRWGLNKTVGSPSRRPAWIRRCTAPRLLTPEVARRIVSGDPGLAMRHSSREAALNAIRAVLGADRYARWRRRVLDAVAGAG